MEYDNIKKVENRIRGAGMSVSAFLRRNDIPQATWHSWRVGSEPGFTKWVSVLEAVEHIEREAE